MSAALRQVAEVSTQMTRLRRPISALPMLTPKMLWQMGHPRSAFPFAEARTRFFYLGRGAVWHAMKRLSLSGEEVLVPAYHHGVEVEAMVDAGVKPRFYGVRRSFDVDLVSLAQSVTLQTKAVYVIHYTGFPQPMDDILTFARERSLKVIEDCALSLLSRDGLRPLGVRGDAAIFCLYKTLPVPHGGALWMPHDHRPLPLERPSAVGTTHQIASSLLLHARNSGSELGATAHRWIQDFARLARAVRPLPVDQTPVGSRRFVQGQERVGASPAALRIANGLDLDHIVEARRRNYAALAARLRDIAPPMVPELRAGVCPLFYPLWCSKKRSVQARLAQAGVESIDFWSDGSPLVPHGRFPDVDALRAHVLELPIHQDLELADVDALATAVRQAMSDAGC